MRLFVFLFFASFLVAGAHEYAYVTPNPKVLQDRVPVSRLSGAQGEGVTFRIEVPPDAENFIVKTTGGRGDVALYLRYNAHPTPTEYDFEADHFDSHETSELIRLGEAVAGSWYVRVIGMEDFRDVKLTASYELPRGTARPPRVLPAPGLYAEWAKVRLLKPRGTTVRYTTDGSEPTINSPLYTRPLIFSATTRLRARTFGRNDTVSIETIGDYEVVPKDTQEPLLPGVPVHHLAAHRGTAHLLKITVPPTANRLALKMEGGPGDAQLYAKAGTPPTTRDYSHRSVGRGNAASLEIVEPAAGDWFLLLPARVGYSGVSLLATLRLSGVDLITWGPAIDPFVSTEFFRDDNPETEDVDERPCAVQEGHITAGTHRLLRFNTQTRNIGTQDLVLGNPEGDPRFEYFECHRHYHFNGFASYELLDQNNQPVALGRKVSFCLLDGIRWDPKSPLQGKYHCNNQGIQAGWADVYDAGLDGQWVDITGVPPGTYTLRITMNPDQVIEETDYTNNSASTQVVIEP